MKGLENGNLRKLIGFGQRALDDSIRATASSSLAKRALEASSRSATSSSRSSPAAPSFASPEDSSARSSSRDDVAAS